MTYASYEREHLALYAAGFINGAGTTSVAFGCQLTRLGVGVYAAVFGADNGLVNDQSYTFVTPKGPTTSLAPSIITEDTSNLVKTIFARGITVTSGGTLAMADVDTDIEVAIYRTVETGG